MGMQEWRGVKFRTKFLKREVPQDMRIDDLRYWISRYGFYNLCQPLSGRSYGNMSFRIKEGSNEFIITSTGHDFRENIGDDGFVKVLKCNLDKNEVEANGLEIPSSETFSHYIIYKNRSDINAVFHGHCMRIVCNIDLGFVSTENEKPYGTADIALEVEKVLGKENFIIMRNHGFLALGKDIDDAGKITLRAYQKCFQ